MADDFEKLAARGRKGSDQRDAIAARKAEARQHSAKREHSEMLDRALGPSKNFETVAMVVSIAATIGATVAVARYEQAHGGHGLIIVPFVGGFFLTLGVLFGYARVRRSAQYRWLESIPFPFDSRHYLGLLRREYAGLRQLKVTVMFDRPVPVNDRDLITDAMIGALGFLDTQWDGELLVVRSTDLATSVGTGYASRNAAMDRQTGTKAHNGALHAWFRRCIDRGLRKIHRRYPIRSVTVATEPP
jgi:hypothetical protein